MKKFLKVTAKMGNAATLRSMLIEVTEVHAIHANGATKNITCGYVVNREGERVERRVKGGGVSIEFVALHEADIVKSRAMRINNKYGVLEAA
jgi:hypothetical protein